MRSVRYTIKSKLVELLDGGRKRTTIVLYNPEGDFKIKEELTLEFTPDSWNPNLAVGESFMLQLVPVEKAKVRTISNISSIDKSKDKDRLCDCGKSIHRGLCREKGERLAREREQQQRDSIFA